MFAKAVDFFSASRKQKKFFLLALLAAKSSTPHIYKLTVMPYYHPKMIKNYQRRECNGLLTHLHQIRQRQVQQQDHIHDTTVLDGWAGTHLCHYNAKKITERLTNRQ